MHITVSTLCCGSPACSRWESVWASLVVGPEGTAPIEAEPTCPYQGAIRVRAGFHGRVRFEVRIGVRVRRPLIGARSVDEF